jgi:hypothetical protein
MRASSEAEALEVSRRRRGEREEMGEESRELPSHGFLVMKGFREKIGSREIFSEQYFQLIKSWV